MERRNYLIMLFDYYGELLNDKQKEYFSYYYFDNLSLGEISEILNISRNAIHKVLKNIENILIEYEEKLKIYQKTIKIENIIKNTEQEKEILEILRGE